MTPSKIKPVKCWAHVSLENPELNPICLWTDPVLTAMAGYTWIEVLITPIESKSVVKRKKK